MNMDYNEKSVIMSANNAIYFLSRVSHGIAAGRRYDLIEEEFKNAECYLTSLKENLEVLGVLTPGENK
jgi:hypothetical protein